MEGRLTEVKIFRSPRAAALGILLRDLRRQRNCDIETVADAVGKHRSYIGHLEVGRFAEPSAEVLANLAIFFDKPPWLFFEKIGYKQLAKLTRQESPDATAPHSSSSSKTAILNRRRARTLHR